MLKKNYVRFFINYFIDIKTNEEYKTLIQKECIEIYKEKFELKNIIAELEDNDIKFKLVYSDEEIRDQFKGLLIYIPHFFRILWDSPEIVVELLSHSHIKDVKSYLAPFFVNNFYENILSSEYIEDNLLYVISLLLIKEINNLEKIDNCETFLEETICGYVLEELKNKEDVMTYFKGVILNLIEKFESILSLKKINFNIKEINEEVNKTKLDIPKIKNTKDSKQIKEQEIINEKEKEIFNSKYMLEITKEELQKKMEEYEGNKQMEEYFNIQIRNYDKDSKIFSNNKFVNNVNLSKEVLELYRIDFFKVIHIFNELFNYLNDNINIVPYSIKSICKILFFLIKKKFPNINIIEQNILISKFIFNKLFLPILRSPEFNSLINDNISETTSHNLNIIFLLIEKFVSGNFFKSEENNGDYTIFNRYFLDKMSDLLKMFENITKVNLPDFIEKLINGNLPNDYKFDYFNENPDEYFFNKSICFSLDDFLAICFNMEKCEEKIFNNNSLLEKFKKISRIFSKLNLKSNKEIIEKLKKMDECKMIKSNIKGNRQIKIVNYYLLSDLIIKNKYVKFRNDEKPYFNIRESWNNKNVNDVEKTNIIKAKNILSSLLYNCPLLDKNKFNEETNINTSKILKELKKYLKNSLIDGLIPAECIINSLIDCLKLLPYNFQLNDYEKLYEELELEVNNSIKELDFEILYTFLNKLKYTKKRKIYYENENKFLIDFKLNKILQSIVKNEIIPVSISFKNSKNKIEFKIEKTKINSKEIIKNNELKKICPNIESFINKFPNINEIKPKELDLFTFLEELKFSEKIKDYFKIIKEHLNKNLKMEISQKEFEDLNNKIYDYTLEKINDKIYPSQPEEKDNIIFKQCALLSWTEFQHFCKYNIHYIYNFVPYITNHFNGIEKEKSPRKKIVNLNNLMNSISNILKFENNSEASIDEILPTLCYFFIKAKPLNIYKNCKFMKIFLNENELNMNFLHILLSVCDFTVDTKSSNRLLNVSDEEFKKNCGKHD